MIETSIETAVAERVKTMRERHRFRMSSMGSVVSGVRRVRIAFDDVDIADALLDEDGHLRDIFVSVGGAEPYRILGYDVITMGGVGVGKRWTAKQVTVTTLDRAASRGI